MTESSIKHRIHVQSGFTLIELMITLVLGLLISAAALQIYVTSIRTSNVQRSSSELQDASVFGIQQLEENLRLTNLGNRNSAITDRALSGGVVLTGFNIGATEKNGAGIPIRSNYANPELLTKRSGETDGGRTFTGISNTNVGSDQLTIQYRNVTGRVIANCEGQNVATGETVIERYFVRAADPRQANPAKVNKLVLACDAGVVATDTEGNPNGTITGFGGDGSPLITGIDQFKVLLGVQNIQTNTGTLSYVPSDVYKNMTHKPAIIAVKIGMIVSGSTPAGSDDMTDFTLLGENNTIKTDSSRAKLVRTTYETTTLLRNARVISVTGAGVVNTVAN